MIGKLALLVVIAVAVSAVPKDEEEWRKHRRAVRSAFEAQEGVAVTTGLRYCSCAFLWFQTADVYHQVFGGHNKTNLKNCGQDQTPEHDTVCQQHCTALVDEIHRQGTVAAAKYDVVLTEEQRKVFTGIDATQKLGDRICRDHGAKFGTGTSNRGPVNFKTYSQQCRVPARLAGSNTGFNAEPSAQAGIRLCCTGCVADGARSCTGMAPCAA